MYPYNRTTTSTTNNTNNNNNDHPSKHVLIYFSEYQKYYS